MVCGVDVAVCVGGAVAVWHAETPPCVDSKRPRVYRQHAHMFQHVRVVPANTVTFQNVHTGCMGEGEGTCARGAGTHGDVLNVHMGTF